MGTDKRLAGKRVLVIGSEAGVQTYTAMLQEAGADVTHTTHKIDWNDSASVAAIASHVAGASSESKPDAVVAVYPDMPKIEKERLRDPVFELAGALKKEKVPLVVLGSEEVKLWQERFLQGQGMDLLNEATEGVELPDVLSLALSRNQKRAEEKKTNGGPDEDDGKDFFIGI